MIMCHCAEGADASSTLGGEAQHSTIGEDMGVVRGAVGEEEKGRRYSEGSPGLKERKKRRCREVSRAIFLVKEKGGSQERMRKGRKGH